MEMDPKTHSGPNNLSQLVDIMGDVKELEKLVENLPVGVTIVDIHGRLQYANRAAEELLGLVRSEALERSYNDPDWKITAVDGGDFPEQELPFNQVLNNKQKVNDIRHAIEKPDGSRVVLSISAAPLFDPDQQLVAVVAIFNDISQQTKAIKDLTFSETRYHQLVEHISSGVAVYSTHNGQDFIIRDFNQAAQKIENVAKDTIIGKNVVDVFPGVKEFGILDAFRRVWQTGKAENFPLALYQDERISGWRDNYIYKLPQGEVIAVYDDVTEQKEARLKIERQVRRLSALGEVDRSITSNYDLQITLNVILEKVIDQLGVDAADIYLFDPLMNRLTFSQQRGLRSASLQGLSLRLGEDLTGQVALERRMRVVPRLSTLKASFNASNLLELEGFESYVGIPLISKGHINGMLEVFNREIINTNKEACAFLEMLAGRAAIAIENNTMFEGLQRTNVELHIAYDHTIEGWARAMDLRTGEDHTRTQRLADLALRMAELLEIDSARMPHIRRGALLHDIGMLAVPDPILQKNGDLTPSELEIVRSHPQAAFDLLSGIEFLRPALDIPYAHHEHWDGSGYPRGIQGRQIPIAARIFTVLDVWDALSTERPFHPAWQPDEVKTYLQQQSGILFEPRLVNLFLENFDHINSLTF